jgi:tetratricopeptide (TPR) repeat protein
MFRPALTISWAFMVGGWMLSLCAVGAAAGEQADIRKPTPSEQQLAAVQAALDAGEARKALDLLESRTLELSPDERSSLEGWAYFLLGDYSQARRRLESAVRSHPRHGPDLYRLGRVYEADGAPALAAEQFQQAHLVGLSTAELHFHWAVALQASGELLGEVSRCQVPPGTEAPLKPGDFACGGVVLMAAPAKTGWVVVSPPRSALYQVQQALRQDGDRGETLLLAAEVWAAAKRHQEAVADFAKAAEQLKATTMLLRCHAGWAESLLALGDLEGYLQHCGDRMRLAGAAPADSLSLAQCYAKAATAVARRGELQRQIHYLAMSVELDPEVDRLIELADALTAAQRTGEAVDCLRKALERSPAPQQQQEIRRRLAEATYLASPR